MAVSAPALVEAPAELTSLDLDGLAVRANEAHGGVIVSAQATVQAAMDAGMALTEAKARVGHGGWGVWLDENFHASSKTARLYMRLAANADLLLGSGATSIKDADRMLSVFSSEGEEYARGSAVLGEQPATRNAGRLRRERAARAALRKQERDALMRRATGGLPKAYSLTRQLAQHLDRVARDQKNDARQLVEQAQHDLARAEDTLVRAAREGANDG